MRGEGEEVQRGEGLIRRARRSAINLRLNTSKRSAGEFSIASFTVRSTEAVQRGGGGAGEGGREKEEGVSACQRLLLLLLAAVTCGPVAGDGEPGRLVGLSYIIGHFTNILAALLLRHVVERQHLSVGAVHPRVLQETHAWSNTQASSSESHVVVGGGGGGAATLKRWRPVTQPAGPAGGRGRRRRCGAPPTLRTRT